jgi:hypothetical protein
MLGAILTHATVGEDALALSITLGALGSFITAIAALITGSRNKQHLISIDKAVNGTAEGEPTIRDSVEQINHAVNGTKPGEPSIEKNVKELVDRRDLDPKLGEA